MFAGLMVQKWRFWLAYWMGLEPTRRHGKSCCRLPLTRRPSKRASRTQLARISLSFLVDLLLAIALRSQRERHHL